MEAAVECQGCGDRAVQTGTGQDDGGLTCAPGETFNIQATHSIHTLTNHAVHSLSPTSYCVVCAAHALRVTYIQLSLSGFMVSFSSRLCAIIFNIIMKV